MSLAICIISELTNPGISGTHQLSSPCSSCRCIMLEKSLVTVRMFIYIVVLDILACLIHKLTQLAHPMKGCKWVSSSCKTASVMSPWVSTSNSNSIAEYILSQYHTQFEFATWNASDSPDQPKAERDMLFSSASWLAFKKSLGMEKLFFSYHKMHLDEGDKH
jgi:hypothetical protein